MLKPLALVFTAATAFALLVTPDTPDIVNPMFDTDSDHTTPGWISLNHFGALDTRSFDIDRDGDLDVLTFFPFNNANHPAPSGENYTDPHGGARWIRFWENRLNETLPSDPDTVRFPEILPTKPDFPFEESAQLDVVGGTQLSSPYTMLLIDVNADGFEDMVIANQRTYDCVYFWNQTTGRWGNYTKLNSNQTSQTMTSVNEDPIMNGTTQLGCYNDNPNEWPLASSRFTVAMDTADLNSDGLPDLVMGYRDHPPAVLLNNHGGAAHGVPGLPFVQAEALPVFPDEEDWAYPNVGNRVVILADLDRDGDADCIVGRSSSITFECHASHLASPPVAIPPASAGGALDAVRVYQNVYGESPGSTAFFVPAYKLAPGAAPEAIANGLDDTLNLEPGNQGDSKGSPSLQISIADLDGDGALDLIVPVEHAPRNWYEPDNGTSGNWDMVHRDYRTRVYLGDGKGHLGTLTLPRPEFRVAASAGEYWARTDRYVPSFWIGEFGAGINSGDNLPAANVMPADFDRDGDLDLAIAHNQDISSHNGVAESPREMDRLWLNNRNNRVPNSGTVEFSLTPVKLFHLIPYPDAFPPMENVWHISPQTTTFNEYNDRTRYIRTPDLDNDGAPDWIESNFINLSTANDIKTHHVRIFLSSWSAGQLDRFQ